MDEENPAPVPNRGPVDRIVDAVLQYPLQALTVALGLGNGQAVVNVAAAGLDVGAAVVEQSGQRWVAAITWLYQRRWRCLGILFGLMFLWFALLFGGAVTESRIFPLIAIIEGFLIDAALFAVVGTLVYWGLVTVNVGSAPLDWLRGFLRRLGLIQTLPDGRHVIDTEGVKSFFSSIGVYGLLVKVNIAIVMVIAPSFFTLAMIIVVCGAIASYITVAYHKRQPVENGFKVLAAWNAMTIAIGIKLTFVYIFLRPIFDAFVHVKGDLFAQTSMVIEHGIFRTIVDCWWNGVWAIGKEGVNWDGVGGHPATWTVGGHSVPAAFPIDGVDAFQLGFIAVMLCVVLLVSPLTTAALGIVVYKTIYTTRLGQARIAEVNDDAAVARAQAGHGTGTPRVLRTALILALAFGALAGGFLLLRWIKYEINTPEVAHVMPAMTVTFTGGGATPPPPSPTVKTAAGGAGQAKPANRKLAEVGKKVRKDLKKFEE